MDEKSFILQLDWRNEKLKKLGTEQWLTVYEYLNNDKEQRDINSAFIPDSKVVEVLEGHSWDVPTGNALIPWGELDENNNLIYYHFSLPNQIQPFVYKRKFRGDKPESLEVLEEFRLFHNLFYYHAKDVFIKQESNGDEFEVIKIFDDRVDVRLKEIKQFLAFKDMHLGIYFDVIRWSDVEINDIPDSERALLHYDTVLASEFYLRESTWSEFNVFSRFFGKKLIVGMAKEKTGIYPYNLSKLYEEFIIGIDNDGSEIRHTCDPYRLNNVFNSKPQYPSELMPIYFTKEVLQKYYENPNKYYVNDGAVGQHGFWSLRVDNNHPDYIVVFLVDLGEDLPYSEQKVWSRYNVVPQGGLSKTAWYRGFLNRPMEPEDLGLLFRSKFEQFQFKWFEQNEWHLFKPLQEDDSYNLRSIHIPLSNNQKEFDEQVIALTKILVDSLNDKELKSRIDELDENTKSIGKLENYFLQEEYPYTDEHIEFLRRLQKIRSISSAHRKGSSYEQDMEKQEIDLSQLQSAFSYLLQNAINLLSGLEEHFLSKG